MAPINEEPGTELAVHCMNENREVGHIVVARPSRVKITADRFWSRFVPAEDAYTPRTRGGRDGGYALCPRCKGKLAIAGVLRTKGKRDLKDAMVPIVLGTTIVEIAP